LRVRRPLSLTQQNALLLVVVFIAFEVLAAIAVMSFLVVPMARRGAGDLSELLALTAQTWSELPPTTRPAFQRQLADQHEIVLLPTPLPDKLEEAHRGPYLQELRNSLSVHFNQRVEVRSSRRDGKEWHWVELPSGGRTLWLGFRHSRDGTQPGTTVVVILAVGLLLAFLAAWWLARQTIAPLKRLNEAVAVLGRGETPETLPETGPRELAALASRVNALVRQVHELLDGRTTLLAGLSHDLRTPLARMRLALEMLDRRPDPKWIAQIEADIEEMNRLVGDMLELARGLGQEASSPIDVCILLEDLAQHARDTGTQVEITCDPCVVSAAPLALRRLLSNLISNAQRYGGDDPLEFRAERTGSSVRIGVLDRGPGIPIDQIEAVFRPFHRVDASRSVTTGGAGLGLAIVQQLAQSNGWSVHLENRDGGGLAAWLTLPCSN
jgi:two-component system, OmpR family, osmolarity sensor histidine kinase EnvZ